MEKYKYEIIIYWSEEDSSYIAEVPELSGCKADGETYKDALSFLHTWQCAECPSP